jgi:hypothetical protein
MTVNKDFIDTVSLLGCIKEDFQNRIFEADERSAVILSFWFDQISLMYRHKSLSVCLPVLVNNEWTVQSLPLELPFLIDGIAWDVDVSKLSFEELPEEYRNAKDAAIIFQNLKDNFVYNGMIDAESYKKRAHLILAKLNPTIPVFLLDVPGQPEIKWGERQIQPDMLESIQNVHKQLVLLRPNTYIIDPLEFVQQESERLDWWHFDRKVYFRIYKRIMELIA